MEDANRSYLGERAYKDFMNALDEIQQPSPLQDENIGSCLDESLKYTIENLTPQQLAQRARWYSAAPRTPASR